MTTRRGTAGTDRLLGTAGNDLLYGFGGHDTLAGGAGNDYLDGGPGRDDLRGGEGNDVYVVDHPGDINPAFRDPGFDRVVAKISYTLGPHQEALTIGGDTPHGGRGNAGDNLLRGNAQANTLDGLGGHDRVYGEGGDDRLVWDPLDKRIDGGRGEDTLRLRLRGQDLDLDGAVKKLESIENIDMHQAGANVVTLKAVDVLAMSDTNVLRVMGDAGDSLRSLGQGWLAGGHVTLDGESYRSFTHLGATLLVDADMTVTVS